MKQTNRRLTTSISAGIRLAAFGFVRVPVPGDGSCLFRVVADKIYGCQNYHTIVRNEAVDYIEANRSYFEPFLCSSDGFTNFEKYAERMRQVNVVCRSAYSVVSQAEFWGGEAEIQAMSKLYRFLSFRACT